MDLVVTFQITPYSDEVAAYMNSLTPIQIYSLFGAETTPEVLTAALLAVSRLRPNLNDNTFFAENLNDLKLYPTAFVVVRNGQYLHHIYTWLIVNPNGASSITNIIGDFTSLSFLINAVETWTKANSTASAQILRVLQPSDQTISLLRRCGFILAKTIRNEDTFRWLFDNSSTGDTPLARSLLFREYDYVAQIDTLCPSPEYVYKPI